MQERIVDYGTTHDVTIQSSSHVVIIAVDESINEAFVLMYHGMTQLPTVGDKGKIIFVRNNRRHWQFYPDTKQKNKS